jgi:hypothetical protein
VRGVLITQVRRILQVQSGILESGGTLAGTKVEYKNMFACYAGTYRHGGIARFYRGIAANILRTVPNTAIQFGVYEYGLELILASKKLAPSSDTYS